MKFKYFNLIVICACFLTALVVFPSGSTKGIKDGLFLCYNVVIPSLFPFTVCTLFLFESDSISFISKLLDKPAKLFLSCSGKILTVFILSCIAGYPVGANLAETIYKTGEISRRQGRIFLGCCVNPGPAFIVIAVGTGILKNKSLGYILLISNVLASLIIAIISSRFMKTNVENTKEFEERITVSEAFVNATYRGCVSIINICSFILIFSSVIGLINEIIPGGFIKQALLAVLEVTNGVVLCDKNIYIISFMLGFGGICVHFQVLSMCKRLKPRYLPFLLQRILHGGLSVIITLSLVRAFRIPHPTISINSNFSFYNSEYTIPFSISLFILTVCFMASIQKKVTL